MSELPTQFDAMSHADLEMPGSGRGDAHYREIVEAMTEGIVRIDRAALIAYVNGRFATLLGYEPAEMVGVRLHAFMSAEAEALATDFLASAHSKGVTIDTAFRHKSGREIVVSLAGSAVLDAAGVIVGHVAVVRDETERQTLRAQIVASDRMASVGTLAAGVAHEINSPLAALIANLELIAAGAESETREGLVPLITDAWVAADRIRSIVHDLTKFSIARTADATSLLDVRAIMQMSVRLAWDELRDRARLVEDYAPVRPVRGNAERLSQVFVNLLVNAAQAMPKGPADANEVRVSIREEGARVLIEVADTGLGVPPDVIDRIFDAFVTTKAIGKGRGLGLAISRRIIMDMSGELTVASTAGSGATFRVALPVVPDDVALPVVPYVPALRASSRGRILVVDDDEMVGAAVERTLRRDHDVSVTRSAKAALELHARGERYDVILCDLMMPEMTGMDLHRELMRIDPSQAHRMAFITGGVFTPEAEAFLADGIREKIDKPFGVAALRDTIRRLVAPLT